MSIEDDFLEAEEDCFVTYCGRQAKAIIEHPQRGPVWSCRDHVGPVARLFDADDEDAADEGDDSS